MKTDHRIQVEKSLQGVLTIALNRPEQRNAFDREMAESLTELYQSASADPQVRVVVLRGVGPVFCAGGDISWMKACGRSSLKVARENASIVYSLFSSIDHCEKPTVVLVQGAALGGGIGLLAASDVIIATEQAVFGTSETLLGIVPACLSPFLIRKIGISQTRRLFLTGQRISAADAIQIGLVHQIIPADQALDSANETLLAQLLSASLCAQVSAKRLLSRMTASLEAGIEEDLVCTLVESWQSGDGQEGMIAFLEKRLPKWSHSTSK